MKSKTKQDTRQSQTNTYAYVPPPITSQQSAYDEHIKSAYDTADPSIAYNFANQRESLNNTFNNPFGANVSPEVQQAIQTAGNEASYQAQGQAMREDVFNRKQGKTTALAGSASMTAPQLVQTGGSSTGSMVGTQTTPIGPSLIAAAGNVGSAALM